MTGAPPTTPAKPSEVASERFANCGEVRSVCAQMIEADRNRSALRAQIDRIWSGNPTYPLHVLKAAGQGWRARVNYREMEGIVSSEQTLDYDLETETDCIIDIDLDYGEGQERRDWEDSIEKHFTWLILQRWDDFNFHTPFRIFQKLLHGMGAHIWPTLSGNWIPRTPRAGSILFPEDCPLNFHEDGDYFMLRDFVPASAVYRWIANEKQATDQGWNVKATWKALAEASNSTNRDTPDKMQVGLHNGDIGYSATRQAGIWLNHMFVREFESGKVTQYIVAEGIETKEYLFKKRDRFDEWPLVLFPYDIGNGTIHSVRGLGPRTKDFFELSNRIKNAMADQVMLSAYPMVKQNVPNVDPDKLKLMRMQAMGVLPYGVEPSLIKLPDLSNGPIALSRELQQTMLFNNRGGMSGQEIPQSDRQTAQEYAMRSMNASKLNNGSVALQKSNLRRHYERMLRLALAPSSSNEPWAKMAKEFRARCERDNVPKEAFKNIAEVRAKVNSGKGSAAAQLQSLMTLMQTVYPATTEDRKIAIERDIVATVSGYNNVERYARSIKDEDMPDGDDSFAVMETENLIRGGDALAAPRQDHIKHLQRHFEKGFEIGAAAEQGQADPQQALAAIGAIITHGEQHLNFLKTNPMKKLEYGELFNAWQQLQRIGAKLQALVADLAESTPPEQKISEDLQIGLAKVEADERVKMEKAKSNERIQWRKLGFQERTKDATLSTDIRRKNITTQADIQRANITAATDIRRKTLTATP